MSRNSYNESRKNSTLKYKRKYQHPVSLSYKNDEFENFIAPAIAKTGLSVATFFKVAAREKIIRDKLGELPDENYDVYKSGA